MFPIRKQISTFVSCLILLPEKHCWIIAKNIQWHHLRCKSGTMS